MSRMSIVRKALKNPKKAIYVLRYRFLKIFGGCHYKKFIILTRSRTGSFLLLSYLDSLPQISTQKEIFSRLNGRDYRDILRPAFSLEPYFIRAAGFKIFYYHPQDDLHCGLWEELEVMTDLHIIHLKRRNILRTLISRKIAATRGVWTNSGADTSTHPKEKAVEMTPEELEQGFVQTQVWEREGAERFLNHPYIEVEYEDLMKDPDGEFRRITDFLGLPFLSPTTYLKKQNPEKIRDLLKDYERIKSAFAGGPWEPFFED